MSNMSPASELSSAMTQVHGLEPDRALRYRHRFSLGAALSGLWRSREIVRSLAERDLRARYKQAVLGFAWAIITPVLLMVVFTFVFRRGVAVDTGDVPYPLFSYLGLLPWTFFSTSVSQGVIALVSNMTLLNKVYCPREVFPIAKVTVAGIDMLIATAVLLVLFPVTGFMPRATSVWVPVLLAIQLLFTLGIAIVISALSVYLRDLRHAVPILLQLGLFATPVAYGLDFIPEQLRTAYVAVNPLGAVIDGYRATVLHGNAPDAWLTSVAAVSSLTIFLLGYYAFKRMETGLADVA
jgi:ABC-2 type transport system permease protein/lipopolysaccharide transport system permease protein